MNHNALALRQLNYYFALCLFTQMRGINIALYALHRHNETDAWVNERISCKQLWRATDTADRLIESHVNVKQS
jgi:hypothetical protein